VRNAAALAEACGAERVARLLRLGTHRLPRKDWDL
jgi:hypothetical protein